MKTSLEIFKSEIESFLVGNGLDATNFGRGALNDPNFVFSLRKGRDPSMATADRVRSFMKTYKAPK